jgi:hypothetical protein
MSGYRVLICGSRDWEDRNAIWAVLWGLELAHDDEGLTVIEGGAKGADREAVLWFKSVAYVSTGHEQFPADWAKHGKAAGPIRNAEMIAAKPDVVWAFVTKPLEESRGTHDMVIRARAAGIPTYVVMAA